MTGRAGSTPANDAHTDWAKVKDVFSQVMEAPAPRRAAIAADLCGADEQLRAEVEALLAAHGDAGGFFEEQPTRRLDDADPDALDPRAWPEQIGPYRIERPIGEGGFGLVYRARQESPVERDVAVKVLRPEVAAPEAVRRFVAERQVQARMDHPGIVKVLDAGVAPGGGAYIAMELVEGANIIDHVRTAAPPVRVRARLMAEACRALHHAHQRAVIHRDVKPSNILVADVDGRPTPRVIDFGIAKSISEAHAGPAGRTREGAVIGTPAYMSPAQLLGEPDVDVRTDIYALGVVLCEVLTGGVPRDAKTVAARLPHETPADPPSRLAALAQRGGGAELAAPSHALRGDLDRIVLKATAWDPDARYDSAASMADDLERYLRGEPVLAVGPSRVYRLRKFIGRHRVASTLTLVAGAALVIGAAVATAGQQRARAAERRAAQDAARAEFATEFLLSDMIAAVDPDVSKGRDITVREVLDAAAARAGDRFRDDPELHLDVLALLANAYVKLNQRDQAVEVLREAVALAVAVEGPTAAHTLHLKQGLARALMILPGAHEEAGALQAEVRDDAVRHLGPDHPVSLKARLYDVRRTNNPRAAIDEAEDVRRALRRQGDDAGPVYLHCLRTLSIAYGELGDVERRLTYCRQADELAQQIYGTDHSQRLVYLNDLAEALILADRPDEAAPIAEEAVERSVELFGPDHGQVISAGYSLVKAYTAAGRPEDALRAARDAERAAFNVWGEDSIAHINAQKFVGGALTAAGRPGEAEPILRRVLELQRAQWGDDSFMVGDTHGVLAQALFAAGRIDAARAHAQAAVERTKGRSSDFKYSALLARCLVAGGDPGAAATLLQDLLGETQGLPPAERRIVLRRHLLPVMIDACAALGDAAGAERARAELRDLENG